jgi:hypothetical protein
MINSSIQRQTILNPILVRYFVPQQGVKTKTFVFTNLSRESYAQPTEHIACVFEEAKLTDKAVSLSGNRNNTHFDGAKKRRIINVLVRLRNETNRDFIGVGCKHIRLLTVGHRKYCRQDISAFPCSYTYC